MTVSARLWAAATAVAALAIAGGCGLGPGESSQGEATLTITRDYGSQQLREVPLEDPVSSLTVLRALDGVADIETRYGGAFVHAIDAIEGTAVGARRFDWFFYVNGTESSVGAAEVEVEAGDRVWWDYRDWTAAMRVPAVVGSWPQPFAAESGEVSVICLGEREPCDVVDERLVEAGAATSSATSIEEGDGDGARILVGAWADVRADSAASLIDDGPASSGVFAQFGAGPGNSQQLHLLDETAGQADALAAGGGLVAAVREGEDDPTWLVTGTDNEGVRAAAELLSVESLRNHYAVATDGERELPLPVLE